AGWLPSTQVSMPVTPTNPAGTLLITGYNYSGGYMYPSQSTVQDETPRYRENFRKTYLAGLSQSATHVPVLPAAEGAFGKIPSNPYTPTGTDGRRTPPGNNGNNGNGGNGGNGNGRGAPAPHARAPG